MRIDRAHFLLLTASMAGNACGASHPPQKLPPEPAEPAQGPVIDVVPVAEPADQPLVQEPPPGMHDEPLPGLTADDEAIVAAHQQAAPTELAAMCRMIRPPPGPYCESIHDTTHSCEIYEKTLKPEAARRATECLVHKSGTRAICRFGIASMCFLQGARAVATVPAAGAQCSAVMQRCGTNRYRAQDMTMAHCQAAVSAVQIDLQRKLVSCISEGCGVGSCLYYLVPP